MYARTVQLVDLTGGKTTLNLAESPLASGGAGAIYLVKDHQDLVVKLYHQPQKDPQRLQKLQAMLAGPPQLPAIKANQNIYLQIAWPVGWIADKKNNLLGFAMPKVNLSRATALENLLSKKSRQVFAIPEGYGYRVTAAANLAALVTELHACGHHVVDLKPINLSVYIDAFYIAILDCDGFSIRGLNGEHYPAHQFSDGYIAPESLRGRHRPENLGEDQDRFALAVVLFQLLNQGIHPYQGVPAVGVHMPSTNGERIERELFAYGSTANRLLAPSPWSIHKYLEDNTLNLFERAFTTRNNRPSAKEWRDHLMYFADKNTGALHVCPKDNDHGHYSKGCGFCAIEQSNHKLKQHHKSFTPKKGNQHKNKQQPVHVTNITPQPRATPALWTVLATLAFSRFVSWWQRPRNTNSILLKRVAIGGVTIVMGWFFYTMYINSSLLTAAAKDQPDTVAFWLKYGANTNTSNTYGQTSLYYAVKNNNHSLVQLLLQHGAKGNVFLNADGAPIQIAVQNGNVDIIKSLLAHGAEINAQYRDGMTVLIQACHHRHPDIVKLLLDSGADVNSIDNTGRTALHCAAMIGDRGIMKMLLARGANIDIKDYKGKTVFDTLASLESSSIKNYMTHDLRSRKSMILARAPGRYILTEAVIRGDLDTVRTLLDKGAPLDTRDLAGSTLLRLSKLFNQKAITDLLLAKMKTDPNTLLYEAVKRGDIANVHSLIENGANIETIGENGKSLLAIAILNRHKDMVSLLLDKGMDINATQYYGEKTFLHYEVEGGHIELVKYLLAHKADINSRTSSGETPLQTSLLWRRFDIAKLLITSGADINSSDDTGISVLHEAVKIGNNSIVAMLVNGGANINTSEAKLHNTALHLASHHGNKDIVKILITAKNINIDAQNYHGMTALHFAATKNHFSIVKLLLENGASPKLKTFSGSIAEDLAAKYGHKKLHQYFNSKTSDSPHDSPPK